MKQIWTPAKLTKLAREHAKKCFTHTQFIEMIGISRKTFYACLENEKYTNFRNIIKSEIDSQREPVFNDLAESVIHSSLTNALAKKDKETGEEKLADIPSRELGLRAAIFFKKTHGWSEAAKDRDGDAPSVMRIGRSPDPETDSDPDTHGSES